MNFSVCSKGATERVLSAMIFPLLANIVMARVTEDGDTAEMGEW